MKLSKIMGSFKFNDENKTKVIGLLTILIAFWLVFYFIPEVFVTLFNTLLGNLILMVSVLLVYMNNRMYGIMAGLILFILFRFSQLTKQKRENFTLNVNGTFEVDDDAASFTKNSKTDFLKIQNTINKQKIFDMDVLETQATQEELDYFNKYGKWPWSRTVIDLYKESVKHNPFIRTDPNEAVKYARTVYNQNAILRILSYQTKEGQFLLNGVLVKDPSGNKMEELPSGFGEFGYTSGLIENRTTDIIKCNLKDDANPTLERIRYTGKGGIYGEQTKKVFDISYNDLEKSIPGFKFLSSPCNPCKAMSSTPDYSCPFRLKVKHKSPFISSVWQYLWGLNDNPLESKPSFILENINPNEFPLLSELQTEIQKQYKYQLI